MAQFFKDSLHIVSRMTDSDKHVVPPRRQEKRLVLCAAATYNTIDWTHFRTREKVKWGIQTNWNK